MTLKQQMPDLMSLIPYEYETIKREVYEDIIAGFLQSKKPALSQKILQVSGIPSSGKSTFINRQNFSNDVCISFDAIMDKIPSYHEDIKKLGLAEAFKIWEMPARVIGYELLRRAIDLKLNIVLEHSGSNQAHLQLFKNIKKAGYKTEIVYLLCSPDKAGKRCLEREKIIQRHTPSELIHQRYNLLNEYMHKYTSVADSIKVYNSEKDKFILRKNYLSK